MKVLAIPLVIGVLSLVHGRAACADEPTDPVTSPIPADAILRETVSLERTPQLAVEYSSDPARPSNAADPQQNLDHPEGLPVYTPPRRGAPKTRVGGGTRQLANDEVALMVLSPPHTGLTQQAQPTLYWFLSADHAGPFEFVVTTADAAAPLWRQRVDGPLAAGIHALSLREHNVELADGVEYQWSVAIVRDPERRSRDLVTIGTLQRLVDGSMSQHDGSQQDGADAVIALAQRGLWYDALQRLGELDEQSRDQSKLVDYRAALLDQADLPLVADYVRNHSSCRAVTASC